MKFDFHAQSVRRHPPESECIDADFDTAIAMKLADEETCYGRAAILVKKNDLAQARADLEQALRINPAFYKAIDLRTEIKGQVK